MTPEQQANLKTFAEAVSHAANAYSAEVQANQRPYPSSTPTPDNPYGLYKVEPTANPIASTVNTKRAYAGVGSRHWIQKNIDQGAIILLEDRSLWEIDRTDRIHSILWLPISNVVVWEANDGSFGNDYILVNSNAGGKVHAEYLGTN